MSSGPAKGLGCPPAAFREEVATVHGHPHHYNPHYRRNPPTAPNSTSRKQRATHQRNLSLDFR